MKAREFISKLRHHEIVEAIRAAEKNTSGEIRVFITRKAVEQPVIAAQEQFTRLRMDKTREHNGVLIYVAPRARKFAVIGDKAVHEKCGDAFWKELTQEMSKHFRDSHYTRGILHGVKTAGDLLAVHFPCRKDKQNELSDDVETD
jgi:uncharacterized membrane protein